MCVRGGFILIGMAALGLLNLFMPQDRGVFFYRFLSIAGFLIVLRLLQAHASSLKPRVDLVFLVCAWGLGLYGLVQRWVIFPALLERMQENPEPYVREIIRLKSGRIFSLFSLPTLYGVVLAVLVIWLVNRILERESMAIGVVGDGLLLFLLAVNLVLTQSFGAVLSLGLGLLVLLRRRRVLSGRRLALLLMVGGLLFFSLVGLRYSEARSMEPVRFRLFNWRQAVAVIRAHPLWGVGLGGYAQAVSREVAPHEIVANSPYAHNAVLQGVAEVGMLPALFLLLGFALTRRPGLPGGGDPSRWLSGDRPLAWAVLSALGFYALMDIGFYFTVPALLLAWSLALLLPRPLPGRKQVVLLSCLLALMGVLVWARQARSVSGEQGGLAYEVLTDGNGKQGGVSWPGPWPMADGWEQTLQKRQPVLSGGEVGRIMGAARDWGQIRGYGPALAALDAERRQYWATALIWWQRALIEAPYSGDYRDRWLKLFRIWQAVRREPSP